MCREGRSIPWHAFSVTVRCVHSNTANNNNIINTVASNSFQYQLQHFHQHRTSRTLHHESVRQLLMLRTTATALFGKDEMQARMTRRETNVWRITITWTSLEMSSCLSAFVSCCCQTFPLSSSISKSHRRMSRTFGANTQTKSSAGYGCSAYLPTIGNSRHARNCCNLLRYEGQYRCDVTVDVRLCIYLLLAKHPAYTL